jgi:hypothetical protein
MSALFLPRFIASPRHKGCSFLLLAPRSAGSQALRLFISTYCCEGVKGTRQLRAGAGAGAGSCRETVLEDSFMQGRWEAGSEGFELWWKVPLPFFWTCRIDGSGFGSWLRRMTDDWLGARVCGLEGEAHTALEMAALS